MDHAWTRHYLRLAEIVGAGKIIMVPLGPQSQLGEFPSEMTTVYAKNDTKIHFHENAKRPFLNHFFSSVVLQSK